MPGEIDVDRISVARRSIFFDIAVKFLGVSPSGESVTAAEDCGYI